MDIYKYSEYDELLMHVFEHCPSYKKNEWAAIAKNSTLAAEICFETHNAASALVNSTHDFLEINSGYGTFTEFFAMCSDRFYCVESDEKKRDIIRCRCRRGIEISEKINTDRHYDYIWINAFEGDNSGFCAAETYKKLLPATKENGRIIMALSSRYENPEQIKTELYALGAAQVNISYPYPNPRGAFFLFSPQRMPTVSELNFDKALCENAKLGECFFVSIFKKPTDTLIFSKMSVMRREPFRIRTDIISTNDGLSVIKAAVKDKSKAHINRLQESFERLSDIYPQGLIEINRVKNISDGREAFEFIDGENLFDIIAADLNRGKEIIYRFAQILHTKAVQRFKFTEDFYEMFGHSLKSEDFYTSVYTNIDFCFDNIIVKNGRWIVTDYEFCADFPVPVDFVIFRAVFYLFIKMPQTENSDELEAEIYSHLGISDLVGIFRKMEYAFQRFVTGDENYLPDILKSCGQKENNFRNALKALKKNAKE